MRRTTLLLLVAVLSASACSSSPKRGDEVIGSTAIKADSQEAQRRYESALALLESAQWASAEEEFRLIQSDFPNDAIAQVSELYSARAALRDFENADAGPQRALPLLSGLAEAESVDSRIRYAAMVYLAAAHAALGDAAQSLETLKSYPGASLSPNILARDRVDAWTLVVEGLAHAHRESDAVAALAEAFSEVTNQDSQIARYARSRAFELIAKVDEDVLNDWSTDESVFLRAVGGYGLARKTGAQTPVDVLDRATDALNAIQEGARAIELLALRPQEASGGPLRVGLLVPLTGPNRAIGEKAVRGATLASLSTPNGKITLIIEDSEDSSAFDRLDKAGVIAVVGPVDATRTKEVAPLALNRRLPVIALSTEIPTSTDAWVFQDFVDADEEARASAQIAVRRLAAKRVAILSPDIGYGTRMAREFKTAVEANGGTVVFEKTYDRKSTDFTKIAGALLAAKPDAVFIPDTGAKVAEVTAFLAAKNIWGRTFGESTKRDGRTRVYYLGTSLWQDDALLRQAGTYVEGALIPAWFSPVFSTPASRVFYNTWNAQGFTQTPSELELFSYDAVSHIVSELSRGSRPSRVSLRQGLLDTTPSTGASSVMWGLNGKAKRALGFVSVATTFVPSEFVYVPDTVDPVVPSE